MFFFLAASLWKRDLWVFPEKFARARNDGGREGSDSRDVERLGHDTRSCMCVSFGGLLSPNS
jgi:hypothetical protein